MKYLVGDFLTGRRIQTIPDVISGTWAERLNAADSLSCTVPLNDPGVRKLGLPQSATPWKSFLAAIDGTTVLAFGPVLGHSYAENENQELTITAGGVWDWFTDKRLLLPELAGRLPSDPTTDTNLVSSLQGIAVQWVTQALSITGANIPMVLPSVIGGTNERNEAGANMAFVGERLTQLTQVEGGPDIKFAGRFTTDMLGIETVMQVGTPTQPQIFGAIRPTFNVGLPQSSVSNFKLTTDGSHMGSRAFASGGRGSDEVLITQSDDSTLPDAGYVFMEMVDSSHSTVSEGPTLQGYSDELVVAGRKPVITFTFDHALDRIPSISGFNVGDYANVKIKNNGYLPDDTYVSRIVGRSGDAQGKKVSLTFQAVQG